jgi:hypothetical protein
MANAATLSFDRLRINTEMNSVQAALDYNLFTCSENLMVTECWPLLFPTTNRCTITSILTATLMNVKELKDHHLASDYIPGKYLSFTTG